MRMLKKEPNVTMLSAYGQTLNLRQWAALRGIPYGTVCSRFHRHGPDPDKVLFIGRMIDNTSRRPPKSREWDTTLCWLPFELDAQVKRIMRANPGGAPLHAIADEYGVSKEAVRQLEESALRKLKKRFPHIAEWLRIIALKRDKRGAHVFPDTVELGDCVMEQTKRDKRRRDRKRAEAKRMEAAEAAE